MTVLFRTSFLLLLAAALAPALSAAPTISEIMASNKTTLADADGAFSDWVEIHNPDAEPLNLDGWYLTDNAAKRTKWQFPAVTIPAGGYLVVFASEKDRRDPAAELHTSFALSAEGEYLGLIQPDGVTAAAEFAPAFPAQRVDVSYGSGLNAAGASSVGFLQTPTPGAANGALSATEPSKRPQVQLATASGELETFVSDLPIVVLDNKAYGPQELADGEIAGSVQLYTSDVAALDSAAGIKVRGATSAEFPKKSFSLELRDSAGANVSTSVLGMAKSADWALVSPWWYDPSYIRSAYVYALSNTLGRWAPRTRFTEVFAKQDGAALASTHYAGLSVLTERIKIASDLVDIKSLAPTDVAGDAVTGGYIIKFDPKDADEFGWRTDRGIPAEKGVTAGTMLVVVSPKAAKLAPDQQDYITAYVQVFENALFADAEANFKTRDYAGYIDRASWVDFHLLQVLAKNPDGLVRSAYFHKDRGGKLKAGPVWDFDRAMGSMDERSLNWDEWNDTSEGAARLWETGWWGVLARDPDFIQAWIDRWQTLRRTTLSTEKLVTLAEGLTAQVGSGAAARDAARWSDDRVRFSTYREEIDHLIAWLTNRANWIDRQFVAAPVVVSNGSARQITAPAGSQIIYTLDGSDPRTSGGDVAGNSLVTTDTLDVPAGATLTVRIYTPRESTTTVGSPWSSAVVSAPTK